MNKINFNISFLESPCTERLENKPSFNLPHDNTKNELFLYLPTQTPENYKTELYINTKFTVISYEIAKKTHYAITIILKPNGRNLDHSQMVQKSIKKLQEKNYKQIHFQGAGEFFTNQDKFFYEWGSTSSQNDFRYDFPNYFVNKLNYAKETNNEIDFYKFFQKNTPHVMQNIQNRTQYWDDNHKSNNMFTFFLVDLIQNLKQEYTYKERINNYTTECTMYKNRKSIKIQKKLHSKYKHCKQKIQNTSYKNVVENQYKLLLSNQAIKELNQLYQTIITETQTVYANTNANVAKIMKDLSTQLPLIYQKAYQKGILK